MGIAGVESHRQTEKLIIFVRMANKLRKTAAKTESAAKPSTKELRDFTTEKDAPMDWVALARDGRTLKIVGVVFFVIYIFFLIYFS